MTFSVSLSQTTTMKNKKEKERKKEKGEKEKMNTDLQNSKMTHMSRVVYKLPTCST